MRDELNAFQPFPPSQIDRGGSIDKILADGKETQLS